MAPGDVTIKVDMADVMTVLTAILGRVMAIQQQVDVLAGRLTPAVPADQVPPADPPAP